MSSEAEIYWEYHQDRYQLLLSKVGSPASILVVGPSYETLALVEKFPTARIDTLGVFDARYATTLGVHLPMDLNDCADPQRWPAPAPYDLVVAGEVIEHLQTSPPVVFRFFRSLLRPGGELIVQTPNAASLAKRWALLRGRNPYMMVLDRPDLSQHWREYTLPELLAAARETELEPAGWSLDNCYRMTGRRAAIYLAVNRFTPRILRDCITLTLRRPA